MGGAQGWSCIGGGRLILSHADTQTYKYFDCTQKQTIKFSTDLSGLNCGIISAFYMVAMDPDEGISAMSGSIYNDGQGIGFVSPSGNSLNKQRARTEIDLVEMSGRAAQTTLHACARDNTKIINDRWSPGAGDDRIDMDGLWENANVDLETMTLKNELVFGRKGKDTLASDAIDTSKPVDVVCEIKPTLFDKEKDMWALDLKTTISQKGANDVVLNPSQTEAFIDKSNIEIIKRNKQITAYNTKTGSNLPLIQLRIMTLFPGSELKKMVFLYSLWADTGDNKYTKWLDGERTVTTLGDTTITDKRGNCTDTEYERVGEMQDAINNKTNLSLDDQKALCAKFDTYFNNVYNVSFPGVDSSNKDKYAWVLDYQYRGINNPSGASGYPNSPAEFKEGKASNWHGTYNYSYLICQSDTTKATVPQSQKLSFTDNPQGDDFTKVCNTIYGEGVMSQYNSGWNPFSPQCDWSKDGDCQFIRTNLTPYGSSPSPSPPSPSPSPPSPSPSPPSPSPSPQQCPAGFYKSANNDCKPCSQCDYGIKASCTPFKDTICMPSPGWSSNMIIITILISLILLIGGVMLYFYLKKK